MESYSDVNACPGKRILDGDELLSDLPKLVIKMLPGIASEPCNLFFCLSRDLEALVPLVQT